MKNYIRKMEVILISFLSIILYSSFSHAQNESGQITWTAIPDAPQPFGKAVGGVIGDYFYVFGGQPHTNLALAYSFADGVWIQSTPSDYRIADAGYCVADGAIYRFCGIGSKDIAEKFIPDDTGAGTWTAISPPPHEFRKDGNGCCWDGGDFIYLNNSGKSNNPEGYFARYRISGNSWEALNPPTEPRRFAGMASANNLIYLIGGVGGNQIDSHICQVYDPADSSWGLIAPHPDSLNYTNSTVISDGAHIWTIGQGRGSGNLPASAHVHYFDPADGIWNQETDLPVVRGLSLVGLNPATSTIIQAGGSVGNGMKFVRDGRIGELSPSEPGMLVGTVVDNWYSNPVFEVEVSVFNGKNTLIGVDTTDEYGSYDFTLNPGIYYAVFSKYSYRDSTISDILINSNDTTEVNVILTFQHQCDYVVGDVNGSWSYNGLDITYLIAYFYHGGPAPVYECECTPGNIWHVSCDVDSSCTCDEGDIPPMVSQLKTGIMPFPFPCPDCPPINPAAKEKPEKVSTASSSDRGSGSR